MPITEINAKTILRKHKKIDSWFISRYGMNLYRGCRHNCVYCDGRAEKYQVEGEFGEQVKVKINAPEILQCELDPGRKRKPMKPGFIMLGGGVGDSYQPAEKKYRLTRKAIEIASDFSHPLHLLTKSTLIERDLDILKSINQKQRVIVSMSFSSVDPALCRIFEPGLPAPERRLEILTKFRAAGIASGIYLMPVIPLISDTDEQMEMVLKKAAAIGIDFLIFGGMTLKPGRQQDYFYQTLENYFPEKIAACNQIYYNNEKWGQASASYYDDLHKRFYTIAKKYKIPLRIPPAFYRDIFDENDRVVVMLEHLDYLLKMHGRTSPFGYAAYNLSKAAEPLSGLMDSLQNFKGVGPAAAKIVREILETGELELLNRLLFYCDSD